MSGDWDGPIQDAGVPPASCPLQASTTRLLSMGNIHKPGDVAFLLKL